MSFQWYYLGIPLKESCSVGNCLQILFPCNDFRMYLSVDSIVLVKLGGDPWKELKILYKLE